MRRQRHDRYAADFLQREVEVNELDNVGELHDHAVERSEPFVQKIERQPRRALVELRIRNLLVAIDDCDAVDSVVVMVRANDDFTRAVGTLHDRVERVQ